ncbi:MAG TPA: aminotransferase class V-fold PLP-dependent enzyme [Coxiellaceae bacterium]|nr:aminotransferase class V-fold PLP-dependent enzyme [Coxiellaceae bacterium]
MLDISFIRNHFPSFNTKENQDWIFCENAGGSYVAKAVMHRAADYLLNHRVQPYSRYPASIHAGEWVDLSYELFATALNAEKDEVIFNASTSLNTYILANAFRRELIRGDEIIVTNQDHEANSGVWRRLAEENPALTLKEWSVDPETGALHLEDLKKLISERTKLLCFTHCSNLLGQVNLVKEAIAWVHEVGGRVVLDGVAYAPHAWMDVKALDVDFYLISLYKLFGPQLGLLYAKREHLQNLSVQGHQFNDAVIRKRLCPAGPQYTEIVSALGVIDYYRAVYRHHFSPLKQEPPLFSLLTELFDVFVQHEKVLCKKLLHYLSAHPNVRILGPSTVDKGQRFPVISFAVKGHSSRSIVDHLIQHRIATNNGHFYASRLLRAMGFSDIADGVVRISLLHYNTEQDVDRIIKALELIL